MRSLFVRFEILFGDGGNDAGPDQIIEDLAQRCWNWVANTESVERENIPSKWEEGKFKLNKTDSMEVGDQRCEDGRFWRMTRREWGREEMEKWFVNYIFIAMDGDRIEFSLLQDIVDQEERVSVGEDGAVTIYDDNPLKNGIYRVGGSLVILKFARHEVLGVLEFSGGLPKESGEATLDVGGEEVLKGKIARVFSSYGEVPRTLADFKGLLGKPLNDREKQLVGRWEHVNEEAQHRSWHINREDHTASSFIISPKYDDEGEVVPGEQVRTMRHHIWCVADEVVYFVDLVIDQTVNPIADDSRLLRAPTEIGTLYLVSVDGEKRTFRWKLPEEYGGDAIEPFHDHRIEAFGETEMEPFNEPGALRGFDILKVHEEARGREEAPELEGEREDLSGE